MRAELLAERLPPEPIDVDVEDSLPGPRLPLLDEHDEYLRDYDYDGGLGDPEAPGRLWGGRR